MDGGKTAKAVVNKQRKLIIQDLNLLAVFVHNRPAVDDNPRSDHSEGDHHEDSKLQSKIQKIGNFCGKAETSADSARGKRLYGREDLWAGFTTVATSAAAAINLKTINKRVGPFCSIGVGSFYVVKSSIPWETDAFPYCEARSFPNRRCPRLHLIDPPSL
jgi:hypothetical protein